MEVWRRGPPARKAGVGVGAVQGERAVGNAERCALEVGAGGEV